MIGPYYFRTRIVKGGPLCGLKIWHDYPIDPVTDELLTERPAMWRCDVNGQPEPIEDVAPQFADGTGASMRGEAIDEAEYRWMCGVAEHARKYLPDDPAAKPRQKVDPLTARLPF